MITRKTPVLLFYLAISFLSIGIASAQQQTLKGKVVNKDKLPVEFVHATLLKNDTVFVEGMATDSLGTFLFKAEKGNYRLILEQFGAEYFNEHLDLNQDIDLGEIEIDESVVLEGITITARKKLIERKVDRLVFNVENSVAASGGTAIDVLKVTPNLKVQNDAISIIGKSGVALMINDKLIQLSGRDLFDYISSINASDIKNVEVITNPPAKYQAEGNSGIINIKLKNTISNTWSNAISTSYSQSTYPLFALGDAFNYNKNKLTIGANVNFRKGSSAPIENNWIYYPEQTWNEKNNRRDFTNYLRARLAIDYKLTKKISTGFQYDFTSSRPHFEQNNVVELRSTINSAIDSLLVNIGYEKEKSRLHVFNYNLVYTIDSIQDKKISFDFNLLDYKVDNNRIFSNNNYLPSGEKINNSFFSGNNIGNQNIKNYAIDIDVNHPTNYINLNYGARISFSQTDNNLFFYNLTEGSPILDENQTDIFDYKENVQAAYFSAQKKFGEKWEAQVGVRYEATQTTGYSTSLVEENKINYGKLFPTAYVLYQLNEKNTININYGRRINRPRFNWLNPFRNYSSLYFYVEGNPFLQPSFSHNLELNYTQNSNLNIQLYYNKIEKGYGQISFVNPEDITSSYAKPINYFKGDVFGVSVSYIFKKIKWWESLNSINYNYSSSKSYIPETNQNLKGNNAHISLDNTFIFSNVLSLNLNYFYAFAGVSDLYESSNSSQLNMTLRAFFLDKKIQIALFGNDIFRTNKPIYTGYTNGVQINSRNYYDLRSFGVSLIYRFGNSQVKKVKYSNNDEQNRL